MAARTYTPEQREAARRPYEQGGPAHASRVLAGQGIDVKSATVSQWAKRYGWQSARNANVEAAIAAARAGRVEQRERLIDLSIVNAEKHLVRAYEAKGSKDASNFQYAAKAAIHDAELLTGRATSRSEALTREQAESEVKRIRDELAERRQQRAA